MDFIGRYWKAIVGFLVPAAVVITSAVQATSDGGTSVTKAEWITAICAAVVTSSGVGLVKNRTAPTPDPTPELKEPTHPELPYPGPPGPRPPGM